MVKTLFLDSSALIKRYVLEKGSQELRHYLTDTEAPTLILSQITQAELYSAIMRRHREGTFASVAVETFEEVFKQHNSLEYNVINISQPVVDQAVRLLKTHSLRTADAIQLSCCLTAKRRLPKKNADTFEFLCADKRLIEAALSENLEVVDFIG